jgi:hypothetical protein
MDQPRFTHIMDAFASFGLKPGPGESHQPGQNPTQGGGTQAQRIDRVRGRLVSFADVEGQDDDDQDDNAR